jgi:F-type H+-transporting ATPase subunit a
MNTHTFIKKGLSFYTTMTLGVFTATAFLVNVLPTAAAEHGEEGGIAVHLAPPVVGHIGSMPITATLISAWVTMVILITLAYFAGKNPSLIPSKLQSVFEVLIGSIFDYMTEVLESKKLAMTYFPIVMTIFIFVLSMNWFGLLPGVTSIGYHTLHGETSAFVPFFYPSATDLNITIALAIVAFLSIEVAGVTVLGIWKYGGKFINFSSPLAFAVGLIELISELARLIAFSFRLFGNIFAGKVLLLVVVFLTTPYIVPIPLIAYEAFVGFIQAFIFAILTLYFIKIAVEEPH